MAVGQCDFPTMPSIAGITLGTACAGIKQTVRDDILLFFVLRLCMLQKPI
ncbi:MAG: N-acetylglutamate synthase [Methylococcaceae bacterium NSP1-2]|nr:MAG: N-acetylglutamate synthase [Methylococcaceae bacterium NSP1-2]